MSVTATTAITRRPVEEVADGMADVVVVGAGIVGLACALELAHAGFAVTVVGPQTGAHAGQASRAAGAMLTVYSEVEAAHPSQRVAVELAERIAARAGYEEWLDQLAELGGVRVGLTPGVWVTASVPADRVELAAIAAAAADAGDPGERHSPGAVPGLGPGSPVFEALWLPGEAGVDAAHLTAAVAAAVAAHPRVTWVDDTAITVADDGTGAGAGITVATDSGLIRAGQLLLAAGVGIPALLRRSPGLSAGIPPVLAGRGVSLVLRGVPTNIGAPVRTPNRGFACGAHLVARDGGEVYLGATNRLSTRPELTRRASADELVTLLHDGTHELNAGLRHAQVVDVRVGYRPFTVDHLPLIGRTRNEKVLVATATYRCGMLLAPRIATLIRREIEHPGAIAGHPYTPLRTLPEPDLLALLTTHAETLAEVVCQPGGRLPAGAAGPLGQALRAALAQGAADPVVRRLFAAAPVAEALPLLLDTIGRPQ
jgi:glycine oxidase